MILKLPAHSIAIISESDRSLLYEYEIEVYDIKGSNKESILGAISLQTKSKLTEIILY